MKLTPIYPRLNGNVGVICIGCQNAVFHGGFADLQGEPFRAYYCDRCVEEIQSFVGVSS